MPEKLNTKSDERSWQIERGCCPPPRQMNGPAGTCGQNVCAMKATFGSTNKIEDSNSSSRQSKITTTTTEQRRRLSRVDLSMFVCLFICTLRIRNVFSFERSATREQIETQPQSVQIGTTTTIVITTTTTTAVCGVLSTCSARAGANQPQIAVQRI